MHVQYQASYGRYSPPSRGVLEGRHELIIAQGLQPRQNVRGVPRSRNPGSGGYMQRLLQHLEWNGKSQLSMQEKIKNEYICSMYNSYVCTRYDTTCIFSTQATSFSRVMIAACNASFNPPRNIKHAIQQKNAFSIDMTNMRRVIGRMQPLFQPTKKIP